MTRIYVRVCAAMLSTAPLAYAQIAPVPATPVAPRTAIASNQRSTPMSFEPNHGQTAAAVKFLARGNGYITFLEPDSATLLLSNSQMGGAVGQAVRRQQSVSRGEQVLRMKLVGANPKARMQGDFKLPGYVNYLTGNRSTWLVGLPTYAATTVHQVYTGIDLVYYGTKRRLEYDFVVAPKADPRRIRLAIDGAHPMVTPNGDLRLRTGKVAQVTDVVFRKPSVYQTVAGHRRTVDTAYTIDAHGRVGFKLSAYDPRKKLIIDPVISYASYFGGAGEDEINGSALNANNELYAVGQTKSTTLPGTTGEFQSAPPAAKTNGGHYAFVTKFSADGSTVLWTTYLGGSGDDAANGVAVNAADQAYVVGYTNSCGAPSSSPSFPFTSDAVQTLCNPQVVGFNNFESNGGGYDAFLVKLSSDGKTLLYGTPLGGTNNDFASSVALDPTGKVYIVGETSSTQYFYSVSGNPPDVPSYPVNNHGQAGIGTANYPTTPNAFYSNTAESKQYATTDGSGNVSGPNDQQAFLTVLSADLHTMVYSTLIGGPVLGTCGNGNCDTNGIAVAVNVNGIAYIGGNTSSAHWPTTSGAFAPTCANAGAATSTCSLTGWLAAFDPTKTGTASLLFTTYVNGSSAGTNGGNPLYPHSDVFGLAIDSQGNVVATGDTNANNFPTTTGVLQPACVLSTDGNGDINVCTNAFVAKFSPSGATLWSTYYHGTAPNGNTIAQAVALDAQDNVYVVGMSTDSTLPLLNPVATNSARQDDVFLFKLTPDAKTLLAGTFLGSTGGVTLDNDALHIDGNGNAYFTGYTTNSSFPTTANAFDTAIQGSDGWVVKMTTELQTANTTLVVSPLTGVPGTSVTFTATVAGVSGLAIPTGTVSFNNGSTVLGTGTVNGTGVATLTSTSLAAGTYSVVAVYSGDALYSTASSSAQTLTLTAPTPAPTVTLTASPTAITLGATSTLTWSSTNATACTASNGWSGSEATSGNVTVTPGAVGTVSYVLSCTGTGGTGSATASVSVSAAPPPAASSGSHGGGGALDWWSLGGLIACVAVGAERRRSERFRQAH